MNLDGSAAAGGGSCCGALVKGSQWGRQLNNGAVGQVNAFEVRSDALYAVMKGLCQYCLVAALHKGYSKGVIAFIQRLLGQVNAMVLQQVIALVVEAPFSLRSNVLHHHIQESGSAQPGRAADYKAAFTG